MQTGNQKKPILARNAEAADIAWEWLRRNCGYQRDYMALTASE
ncbi:MULTISPECIES: DUF6499 domain-containing protein [unclassified Bradyrhizobium]